MHASPYMAQDGSGGESVCSRAHRCDETAGWHCAGAAGRWPCGKPPDYINLPARTSYLQSTCCKPQPTVLTARRANSTLRLSTMICLSRWRNPQPKGSYKASLAGSAAELTKAIALQPASSSMTPTYCRGHCKGHKEAGNYSSRNSILVCRQPCHIPYILVSCQGQATPVP